MNGLDRLLATLPEHIKLSAPHHIAKLLNDKHPHDGQLKVIHKLIECFGSNHPIFVQCGRKFGKTELAAFIAYLHCILTERAAVYYIAPFFKQAKEILWAPKRIQGFAPTLITGKPNESELRLRTINTGFIKLDGADNIDTARGFTPSLVIYDEYKDFKPGFHVAMEPNFLARKAQLVVLGTPPEMETEFFDMAAIAKQHGTFFQMPSSTNPYIDPSWLAEKEGELRSRGEEDVWAREYEGRFVRGGKRAIFPMFDKDKVVLSHETLMKKIQKEMHKLQFVCVADPGTVSVFGVLFMAFNPYTRDVYALDEIYESDPNKTSVDGIVPQIKEKEKEFSEEWDRVCDEAASWFINEASQRYNMHFFPTTKAQNKKETGIGLIKDILMDKKLYISDRCKSLAWEMDNYVKDGRGQIPKGHDHLNDCVAEGSLVSTSKGKVPIERVQLGDWVNTSKGYKRVLDHWSKGERDCVEVLLSTGKRLICTPEHRIRTESGWSTSDSLRYGSKVWTEKKLNLGGWFIVAIQAALAQTLDGISGAVQCILKRAYDTCTEISGLITTEKYPLDFTFTIETMIHSTTTSATLSSSVERSTFNSTPRKEEKTPSTWLREGNTWRPSDHSLQSGTAQKLERLGIKSTQNDCAAENTLKWRKRVFGAVKSLWDRLKRRVNGAISTARPKHLDTVVALRKVGKRPVYDLTIEGAHEFFANGVLVHNCFRYALGFWNYDLNDRKERANYERENAENKPWYSMEDDFPELNRESNDLLESEFLEEVSGEWEEALSHDY